MCLHTHEGETKMQTKSIYSRARTGVVLSLALACVSGVTLAAPSAVWAQDRRDDRSTQDRRDNKNQDRRGDRPQDRRDNQAQDHHSDVRDDRHRSRDEAHVQFTHSETERRFDNGVTLHRSSTVDRRLETYFPRHTASYPHYLASRDAGRAVVSPFSFYVGIFPPYIDRSAVVFSSPGRVLIDTPLYVRGEYQEAPNGSHDLYYLRQGVDDNRWKDDRDLSNTVYDLEDTFLNEDIGLLAPLTDPSANIAIFSRGRYQYSLNPSDYLDMTRDFLRSVHTTEFTAYRVHRKESFYQVFARHTYQDQSGRSNVVYQTIVLERVRGRWTITQIDTSPARYRN